MKPMVLAGGARINPMHLFGWKPNPADGPPGTTLRFSDGKELMIGEDVEHVDALFEDATGLTIEAGE